MSFLTPWGLLFGLLAFPILALYMLRLRRREVTVSSTLLWQVLLRDRQANTPWQRLRRNILLLIQLLILTLMVISLARPAIPIPAVASGTVVVLLDASASMQAIDISPSRFDAARSVARSLVNGLNANSRLTLILVNQKPSILSIQSGNNSSEKQAALQTLQSAAPSSGSADWSTAFALAAGAASVQGGPQETTFVIISDGGLPDEGLPPLPGSVRYVPIGRSAQNLSLSALALRPISIGAMVPELFTSVLNSGEEAQQAILSIYANDQLLTARQLTVPAGAQVSLTLNDLPAGPAVYQAVLSGNVQPLDYLSLDNSAYAVFQPSGTRRVLVASEEYFRPKADINIFLEQILASLPGLQAFRVSATSIDAASTFTIPDPSSDPFDLYVFDGIFPISAQTGNVELPSGNLLLINPPPNDLFSVTGSFTPTQDIPVRDHPLMSNLNWRDIYIAEARQIQLPTWGEVLVGTVDHPLVFIGQHSGRRVAVLAFDLNNSDLPLKITFPLLFASLLDYLAPPQSFDAPDGLLPGDSLLIRPASDVNQVSVVIPSGEIISTLPTESEVLFSRTEELGLYTVNYFRETDSTATLPSVDYFSVNLFDESEANIRVANNIQVGRSTVEPTANQMLGQRELWPWLAGIALVLSIIEWWIYYRQHWPHNAAARSLSTTWSWINRRVGIRENTSVD